MSRVGVLTCKNLPEPDHDEQITLTALESAGLVPEMVPWDAGPPPKGIDLFVLRSTWNYYLNPGAFLEVLALCPRLLNPLDTVKANMHKGYLKSIGVRTVPTRFITRGDHLARLQPGERVIKPCVSAGSWKTRVFEEGDPEAQSFLESLVAERDVMIQPFIESVNGSGERSIIWIQGEFTHAIRKMPRFDDQDEAVEPVEIEHDEREFASQVMKGREDLLYARVDLMRDAHGSLMLSELELIEPSLFFMQNPAAAERFAGAVASRIQTRRPS